MGARARGGYELLAASPPSPHSLHQATSRFLTTQCTHTQRSQVLLASSRPPLSKHTWSLIIVSTLSSRPRPLPPSPVVHSRLPMRMAQTLASRTPMETHCKSPPSPLASRCAYPVAPLPLPMRMAQSNASHPSSSLHIHAQTPPCPRRPRPRPPTHPRTSSSSTDPSLP